MADFRPWMADFRSERADFMSERADVRPGRADFRSEKADFRFEKANFRPKMADFRPERTYFRPGRADLRPERPDGEDGQMEGWTNKSTSVFHRTLSPSGPLLKRFVHGGHSWGLPCSPLSKGIADYLLLLVVQESDWTTIMIMSKK